MERTHSTLGGVERNSSRHDGFECVLINEVAIAQVDGAPRAGIETGVEGGRWVRQRSPMREGQLDLVFVDFARVQNAILRPDGNAGRVRWLAPLNLFDDCGISLSDHNQMAQEGQRRTPPVPQRSDFSVYQPTCAFTANLGDVGYGFDLLRGHCGSFK